MPSRRQLANAIRVLSMGAVQRDRPGHPGASMMGMADIAEVLCNGFLRHNAGNPQWRNRDRLSLSNSHGSMLQHPLLHLTGYKFRTGDVQPFLYSKTPGQPEFDYTLGVETAAGPLGQGLADAVGMAITEKVLGAELNRPGHTVVDHHISVFFGDGCLVERISHETCFFAGAVSLNNLSTAYNGNGISIDGKAAGWLTDDPPSRCQAYGWHMIRVVDRHDAQAVKGAFEKARAASAQSSLNCAKIITGVGALNVCGTHSVHGAPVSDGGTRATREFLNWQHFLFHIPAAVYRGWNACGRGRRWEQGWVKTFTSCIQRPPGLARRLKRRICGCLPGSSGSLTQALLQKGDECERSVAIRRATQIALSGLGPWLPELIGGSADLTDSNDTWWDESTAVSRQDGDSDHICYGVREFGMSALVYGIALRGGLCALCWYVSGVRRPCVRCRARGCAEQNCLCSRFHWAWGRWAGSSANRAFRQPAPDSKSLSAVAV